MAGTLTEVIELIGVRKIAKACGVSPAAVYSWKKQNRLPKSEWEGGTSYAQKIAGVLEPINQGMTGEMILEMSNPPVRPGPKARMLAENRPVDGESRD